MEILLLLFLGLVVFLLVSKSKSGKKVTKPKEDYSQRYKKYDPQEHYNNEITTVEESTFKKQRLVNKSEAPVYWELINIIRKLDRGYKVFAQVSLGEILSHQDKKAYGTVQCKRVDFCITDKNFYPVVVVEYDGTGHHNSTANQRAKVKQKASESAGVLFRSIHYSSTQIDLSNLAQDLENL